MKEVKSSIYCEYHPYSDEQIIIYNCIKYHIPTLDFVDAISDFIIIKDVNSVEFICPPAFYSSLKDKINATLITNRDNMISSKRNYEDFGYLIHNHWNY